LDEKKMFLHAKKGGFLKEAKLKRKGKNPHLRGDGSLLKKQRKKSST